MFIKKMYTLYVSFTAYLVFNNLNYARNRIQTIMMIKKSTLETPVNHQWTNIQIITCWVGELIKT